jgi:hypothetical protein
LYSSFSFVFRPAQAGHCFSNKKTRDCFSNRGFFGNLCYCLENPTHDAEHGAAAMPNGRQSFDLLLIWLHGKRVCHFLTAILDTMPGPLSKNY